MLQLGSCLAELVRAVKVRGCLTFRKHRAVELRVLRKENVTLSRISKPNFGRADFGLFVFGQMLQNVVLEGIKLPKSWLAFKKHILQPQQWPILLSRSTKASGARRREPGDGGHGKSWGIKCLPHLARGSQWEEISFWFFKMLYFCVFFFSNLFLLLCFCNVFKYSAVGKQFIRDDFRLCCGRLGL